MHLGAVVELTGFVAINRILGQILSNAMQRMLAEVIRLMSI